MNQEYTTLKQTIIAATSWQDKYRHIMLFGKMLPTLPDALKVDSAKVSGLTPIEAEQIDIASEFTQMDLIKHLSPSRGNGIKAIANEITQFIARYN